MSRESFIVRFTLDGQECGELGPMLEDDMELARASLKVLFGDRLRTTTTARWLVEDQRRPLPPMGRPATNDGNVKRAKLRASKGAQRPWQ